MNKQIASIWNSFPILARDSVIVLALPLILGLFAPCVIYLPSMRIPFAFQPHIILLYSIFVGGQRAALATLLFLVIGALGLPVFGNCTSGVDTLLNPAGGFLFGYAVISFTVGLLAEFIEKPSPAKDVAVMAFGNVILLVIGGLWYAQVAGYKIALIKGILPFIPSAAFLLTSSYFFLRYLPLSRYKEKRHV